jgi:hypothetical protein
LALRFFSACSHGPQISLPSFNMLPSQATIDGHMREVDVSHVVFRFMSRSIDSRAEVDCGPVEHRVLRIPPLAHRCGVSDGVAVPFVLCNLGKGSLDGGTLKLIQRATFGVLKFR